MFESSAVLLVHGINDTSAVFTPMANYLQERGWRVHSLNLNPNNGEEGLAVLAAQVAAYVTRNFTPEETFNLVGFSMGGIVTRYYLQRLGGMERVKRYVTISAPNRGTWLAYLSLKPGIREMRPGSKLLIDLNRDGWELSQKIPVTTIWTPWDLMIIPAFSSNLPGSKEVILPILMHPWMLSDRLVWEVVANALSEPI